MRPLLAKFHIIFFSFLPLFYVCRLLYPGEAENSMVYLVSSFIFQDGLYDERHGDQTDTSIQNNVIPMHAIGSSSTTSPQDVTQIKTYCEIQKLVNKYLNNDQIEDALEVLEYAKTKFEKDLYNIISLLTLYYPKTGQYDKLMDVWEYGQKRGLFFPARYQRYKPLFNTKRYKKFIKNNDQLREEAQKNVKADYEIILPINYESKREYPVLISLHGDNQNIEIFKKKWKLNEQSDQFILAYFQSSQLSGTNRFIWSEDKKRGKSDIINLYNRLKTEYHIDESMVLIGGFSSGGALAIDLATCDQIPLKGFIALCPAGMEMSQLDINRLTKAKTRNIIGKIISGEKDAFAFNGQKKMSLILDKAGINCELIIIPGMGHTFPRDFDVTLKEALRHMVEMLKLNRE
jgi:dienelactone hydrolase